MSAGDIFVRDADKRIAELEAEVARLREAVLNLPVEEMTYEHNGELVLDGYCMQCRGEWDTVKALLRSE